MPYSRTQGKLDTPTVAILSTRLYGLDGVSIEASKWLRVYQQLGYNVSLIAGEMPLAPHSLPCAVIPELNFQHPVVMSLNERAFGPPLSALEQEALRQDIEAAAKRIVMRLRRVIRELGVTILSIENALAIPMNLPLGLALSQIIKQNGLPTIARHHDFYWEKERFHTRNVGWLLNTVFPPASENIVHVTISDQARRELWRRRGIAATWLPNAFDFSQVAQLDGYNRDLRSRLGIRPEELFILQPTRIVRRKGIELAVELVGHLKSKYGLQGVLVISGPAGDEQDEYRVEIEAEAKRFNVDLVYAADSIGLRRATNGNCKRYNINDAYLRADLVTFPSIQEGFGNPVIEAALHRKPLFVNRYPVLNDILELTDGQFDFIIIDGKVNNKAVERVNRVLTDEKLRSKMVKHNFAVARQYFSIEYLPGRIEKLIRSLRS